jgi:hypothetical protein
MMHKASSRHDGYAKGIDDETDSLVEVGGSAEHEPVDSLAAKRETLFLLKYPGWTIPARRTN